MIKFPHRKHVEVICHLSIGDKVTTEFDEYRLKGEVCVIEDIKFTPGTQSSVMVKLDRCPNYIDSDWVNKYYLQYSPENISGNDDEMDQALESAKKL